MSWNLVIWFVPTIVDCLMYSSDLCYAYLSHQIPLHDGLSYWWRPCCRGTMLTPLAPRFAARDVYRDTGRPAGAPSVHLINDRLHSWCRLGRSSTHSLMALATDDKNFTSYYAIFSFCI